LLLIDVITDLACDGSEALGIAGNICVLFTANDPCMREALKDAWVARQSLPYDYLNVRGRRRRRAPR
jgi:hypothetical protein